MMRITLLLVTVAFLLGLMFLTVYDIAHNGVTPLDIVSMLIIAFFGVALIGSLTYRGPVEDPLGDLARERDRVDHFR